LFVKYTAIVNHEGTKDKGGDKDDDKDTITTEQVAIWQSIIDKKRADAAKHRAIRPIFILCRHVDCTPRIASVPLLQTPQKRIVQGKRKTAQKVHHNTVQRGDTAPLRVLSTPSEPALYRPEFMSKGWIASLNPTIQPEANFCTMHWSISAALCHIHIRANISEFLDRVTDMMIQH
jgi:hypothetical protein